MAIYDLGTASLSASGEVTGVGTTWKAPLTLIRVGATIVFKTDPVQIYTISEIISDTQINVYNPNSETVTAGTGYAILAHDGITVQGLAQDVAETLRYYQSRETEVADAVDAFNNFDANDFNSKVTQVNTQHGDVVSIGAQVASDASQVSADKNSAAASASSASSDKDAAAASAQEAADYAASLNVENLLRKDLNFSDVADKSLARTNLGVNYGDTPGTVTQGNDPRLGTLNGKTGGNVSSSINVTSGNIITSSGERITSSGGNKLAYLDAQGLSDGTINSVACSIGASFYSASFSLGVVRDDGAGSSRTLMSVSNGYGSTGYFDFVADSTASCTQWISTSDPRVKGDINVVEEPLIKMRKMRGYTWKYLTSENLYGRGFLSNELAKVFPEAVSTTGRSVKLIDGTTVDNVQGVDLSGATAALHHEAILSLMDRVENLEAELQAMKSGK